MTNQEAIKIAQGLITDFKCDSEIMVDFCNVVIESLEQMDALNKIVEELKTDTDKWWYGVDDDCFMKLSHVLAIIDKYKPKSKESTDADSD